MVYATCFILPEENSLQVQKFLNSEMGTSFSFINEQKVFVSEYGYDGFYMALLEKKA